MGYGGSGIWTTSNTWFLGHTRVSPQSASQSIQPFLHSSPLCPTHRQTDTQTTLRATSVATGRIYAVMCPNNNETLALSSCFILVTSSSLLSIWSLNFSMSANSAFTASALMSTGATGWQHTQQYANNARLSGQYSNMIAFEYGTNRCALSVLSCDQLQKLKISLVLDWRSIPTYCQLQSHVTQKLLGQKSKIRPQ